MKFLPYSKWQHALQSFFILFCLLITAKDLFIDRELLKSLQSILPHSFYFEYYSVQPVYEEEDLKTVRVKDGEFEMQSDSVIYKDGYLSWQDILTCENKYGTRKYPPQEWPANRAWETTSRRGRRITVWPYFSNMPDVNSLCTMCGTIFFRTNEGKIKKDKYCLEEPFNLIVE